VQPGSPGTSPGVAIDPPPAAFAPLLSEGLLFVVSPDGQMEAEERSEGVDQSCQNVH
jgi:hypothetical protein